LSDGVAIDPGQMIRVTAVRTNRIVVMPEDDVASRRHGDASGSDVLEQSADSLGITSLDDPV
jgi:hypothetical protein